MEPVHLNYTTINHTARLEMGLTANEYMVADLVYHLSNNPKNDGWCVISKEWIGSQLGITKRNVNKIIVKLISKNIIQTKEGLLSKSRGNYLKITFDWYSRVVIKGGNSSSQDDVKVGTKFLKGGNKVPKRWEQSSHNKDIYNKDNNKDKTVVLRTTGKTPVDKRDLGIQSCLDTLTTLLGHKPQKETLNRYAAKRLIKILGDEYRVCEAIRYAFKVRDEDRYAPRIYNFMNLEEKLEALKDYGRKAGRSKGLDVDKAIELMKGSAFETG